MHGTIINGNEYNFNKMPFKGTDNNNHNNNKNMKIKHGFGTWNK